MGLVETFLLATVLVGAAAWLGVRMNRTQLASEACPQCGNPASPEYDVCQKCGGVI